MRGTQNLIEDAVDEASRFLGAVFLAISIASLIETTGGISGQ